MKFVINQEELAEIISSSLIKHGIPSSNLIEIDFSIDRKTNECYCSIDLGELDLKGTAKLISILSNQVSPNSSNQDDKENLPILVPPEKPISGGTRIKLGSPKNIDDIQNS